MTRYDGKIPISFSIMVDPSGRRLKNVAIISIGKGKLIRVPLSLQEAVEIDRIKKGGKPISKSFDPREDGAPSIFETVYMLVQEVEEFAKQLADSPDNRQIVIDMDQEGNYFSLLINDQGHKKKMTAGLGLLLSLVFPKLELVACEDLFSTRKPPVNPKKSKNESLLEL